MRAVIWSSKKFSTAINIKWYALLFRKLLLKTFKLYMYEAHAFLLSIAYWQKRRKNKITYIFIFIFIYRYSMIITITAIGNYRVDIIKEIKLVFSFAKLI